MNDILKYEDQIIEIAAFAKDNSMDINTQFDLVIKGWIKSTYERSIWIQNNKEKAMELIKSIL